MPQPILTKIAGKFQVTVPPEMREIFELQEGDLLQRDFDEANARILLLPKRAQLLTPVMRTAIDEVRAERSKKMTEPAAQRAVAQAETELPAEAAG